MKKIRNRSPLQDALSVWGFAENLFAPFLGRQKCNAVRLKAAGRKKTAESRATVEGSFRCVARAFSEVIGTPGKRTSR